MNGPDSPTPGLLPGVFPLSGGDDGDSGLSGLDRAIIRALQVDGRQSFAALSRDLDVPEKTIRRRVNQLLADRVIQITTVADPAILGYQVAALVGVQLDGRRRIHPLIESIIELPAVDYAVITTGRYNALVEVLCRDMTELLSVVYESLAQMPGVRGVETFPYLQLHYQEPVWEAAQQKVPDGGGGARPSLDAMDRRIIAELSGDGRLAFSVVGERLGMSESQARKRVTRMLNDRVIRIAAIANPRSLGFDTQVWVAIRCMPGHSIEELAETLSKIPSITYVAACAGRFDIFAEAVCRNTEDVMRLLDAEIRTLTSVQYAELLICLHLYYRAVRPAAAERSS
ncbi:Lrp/AsnC family transcriptional regulator [Sphaerisporangium sp. NBC_01403]|uniref:Lrp/AsnC family transcriptional regulator n=1 Tax=Sphaerisporangium sp. NBC_01403 TaxID=2903599 RepID=UPI0032519470